MSGDPLCVQELCKEREQGAEDVRVRTQELESQNELRLRAAEYETRAQKLEIEYLRLQSEVSQKSQKDFVQARAQFELERAELRKSELEATTDCNNLEKSFAAYKNHAENKLRSLEAEIVMRVRDGVVEELRRQREAARREQSRDTQ